MKKTRPAPLPRLRPARAGAGGAGHHRPQGQGEHHDAVLALHDGVRAAAGGLRDQRAQPQLRRAGGDEGMRDQHPDGEAARQVVGVGNCSGRKVDKFAKFGLTPRPAALVGAPLIAECYASLECRVVDTRMVNRYNFFVLEVVKAWIDPKAKEPRTLHHRGGGHFMVAGKTLSTTSRIK